MTEVEYRLASGLNFSVGKHLLRSGAHFQAALSTDVEETIDMNLGSAVHAFFLGGDMPNWISQPELAPDGSPWHGGKSTCRQWKREQEEVGRVILSGKNELRQIRMIESLKRSEMFQSFLSYAEAKEYPIFQECRGVKIKGKLDLWGRDDDGDVFVLDLKKCPSAEPREWANTVATRRYRLQAEWYSTLLALELSLEKPPSYYWCVVEDSEAAPVQFYRHDEQSAFVGQRQMEIVLQRYKDFTAAGKWPAYADGIINITTNNWELKEF